MDGWIHGMDVTFSLPAEWVIDITRGPLSWNDNGEGGCCSPGCLGLFFCSLSFLYFLLLLLLIFPCPAPFYFWLIYIRDVHFGKEEEEELTPPPSNPHAEDEVVSHMAFPILFFFSHVSSVWDFLNVCYSIVVVLSSST